MEVEIYEESNEKKKSLGNEREVRRLKNTIFLKNNVIIPIMWD